MPPGDVILAGLACPQNDVIFAYNQEQPTYLPANIALVINEVLAILRFFTKQKLQNAPGAHAATWQIELAADLP